MVATFPGLLGMLIVILFRIKIPIIMLFFNIIVTNLELYLHPFNSSQGEAGPFKNSPVGYFSEHAGLP